LELDLGRTLRHLGTAGLAAAAWVLISGEMGWLAEPNVDLLFRPLFLGALGVLGLGLFLAMLAPLAREIRRGRCARCGSRVERGQTYCNDHLRQTVQEYQDQQTG